MDSLQGKACQIVGQELLRKTMPIRHESEVKQARSRKFKKCTFFRLGKGYLFLIMWRVAMVNYYGNILPMMCTSFLCKLMGYGRGGSELEMKRVCSRMKLSMKALKESVFLKVRVSYMHFYTK